MTGDACSCLSLRPEIISTCDDALVSHRDRPCLNECRMTNTLVWSCNGMLGLCSQLLAHPRGANFRAIAADAHFTPATAVVLGGVEEQPAALHAGTAFGAG